MTAAKTSAKSKAGQDNGAAATSEQSALAEAVTYEEAIAAEAAEIRGDATDLDAALFLELWPLLKRPIPQGFIQHVGKVEGKPYPSTGVRSLQVLIDRMNNVLTPLWWWYEVEYLGEGQDHGKLAEVTVYVGQRGGAADRSTILTTGKSRGGVNQASTIGNRFKGSETNAAKRAFAQIGPGHEVYLGATDLDPDVSEEAAKEQAKSDTGTGRPEERKLPKDAAERLFEQIKTAGLEEQLPTKLRGFGVKELTDLTVEQSIKVYEWAGGAVEQPELDEGGEG